MGNPDEGDRTDGLDDRAPVRDRLRKARAQQAALEIDHRSFRTAQTKRPAVEFVLKSAQKTDYGGYSGYFADPDNHPWEVVVAPGIEVGEDRRVHLPD